MCQYVKSPGYETEVEGYTSAIPCSKAYLTRSDLFRASNFCMSRPL